MCEKEFISQKPKQKKQTISNFVVLEGIDGSGKSTQLLALEKKIESKVQELIHSKASSSLKKAFFTAEPTNLQTGFFLRSILKGEIEAHPTTVVHLFAADRAEHLYAKNGILDRCNNGELCICDRYLFSNLAYQGVTCGIELPAKLNDSFPLPTLILYFDIDPKVSLQRAQRRGEAEIYEQQDFLEKTHAQYERVFEYYNNLILEGLTDMKIVRIDACQSQEAIAELVWSYIEPLLNLS